MKTLINYISETERISSIDNYISETERISSIDDYIQEKLTISSKTKVNKLRNLDNVKLDDKFYDNFTAHGYDLPKFESQISYRKKSPNELLKNVTYKEQLFLYWYISIETGWEEGYKLFRKTLIDKRYTNEDELDACVLSNIISYNDKEKKNNLLKYLKEYNVDTKNINN